MNAAKTKGVLADQALLKQRWKRRFLVDPSRIDEVVGLYTRMGLEVHVGRLKPSSFGEGCGSCSAVACARHVLIYTREPQHETGEKS